MKPRREDTVSVHKSDATAIPEAGPEVLVQGWESSNQGAESVVSNKDKPSRVEVKRVSAMKVRSVRYFCGVQSKG